MLHGGYLPEKRGVLMSTYVVSDIHGALEPFTELIAKIGFDAFSGKDELYLLGDYADWGTHSIETVGYIMDLDKSPNVHCLMGNHDLMFLHAIERDKKGLGPDSNWYLANKGSKTWDDYDKLSAEHKETIHEWLLSLVFSVDITVGKKLYMAVWQQGQAWKDIHQERGCLAQSGDSRRSFPELPWQEEVCRSYNRAYADLIFQIPSDRKGYRGSQYSFFRKKDHSNRLRGKGNGIS